MCFGTSARGRSYRDARLRTAAAGEAPPCPLKAMPPVRRADDGAAVDQGLLLGEVPGGGAPLARVRRMILAISEAAFAAMAEPLPLGSVDYEPWLNEKGERRIWIESAAVNKLTAMRGPGESYSDVTLWLAEIEAKGSNS